MTRHTLEKAGIDRRDTDRMMALLKNSQLSGILHERRDITGNFIQVREYDDKDAIELLLAKKHLIYIERNINLLKKLDIH